MKRSASPAKGTSRKRKKPSSDEGKTLNSSSFKSVKHPGSMSSVKSVSQLSHLSAGPSYTSPRIDHNASTLPAPASDQGNNPRRRQEKDKQRQFDGKIQLTVPSEASTLLL